MDDKKLRQPLFVAVEDKSIPAAVQQAIVWVLFNAYNTVVSLAVAHAADLTVSCSQSSIILRCVALTRGQVAEQSALRFGWLCCALLQAAAAAMALKIPRRRRALALAYLALLVTFVGHYMFAASLRLLIAADPGFLLGRITAHAIVVFFAGGDLVCLLGLLWDGR